MAFLRNYNGRVVKPRWGLSGLGEALQINLMDIKTWPDIKKYYDMALAAKAPADVMELIHFRADQMRGYITDPTGATKIADFPQPVSIDDPQGPWKIQGWAETLWAGGTIGGTTGIGANGGGLSTLMAGFGGGSWPILGVIGIGAFLVLRGGKGEKGKGKSKRRRE